MKHSQTVVLLTGLVAAVLGIFYAQKAPYTYIAAGAVAVACVVGIIQSYYQAREADFAQQILDHLARSIPPSPWWKERIQELVGSSARSRGFILRETWSNSSDPDDVDADTIFVFRSPAPSEDQVSGLLIVSPDQYSELATLARSRLKSGVDDLVHGKWSTGSDMTPARRLARSAAALYGLAHFGSGGFPVKLHINGEDSSATITVGNVDLAVDKAFLDQLCQKPAIIRDLTIARTLERLDPAF
jgi:hypothetical protein